MIAMALVLGTSALLLVAGTGDDKVSAADDPATDDKLQLGVVAIDARIGDERVESSGTVVDPRAGLVVTSAHTVWGATSLRLNTGLGILHGRVVARAPCADLAVIEIQPRLPGLVAPKPAGHTPQATELLSAVGRRADALLTIPVRAAGTATDVRIEPGLPPLDRAIRLDAAVVPASSGGALVDGRGQVLGMTLATTRGDAIAVPWPDDPGAAARVARGRPPNLRRLALLLPLHAAATRVCAPPAFRLRREGRRDQRPRPREPAARH